VILNTGAIRFDIFQGAFTRDTTFIVSPFVSVLAHIPDVPYAMARKVIELLNNAGKIMEEAPMDNRFMAGPEQLGVKESVVYEAAVADDDGASDGAGQKPLGGGAGRRPRLTEGYTTRDDIGDDGDDTVHAPVNFYVVPNCIQAEVDLPEDGEPETVDLVFLDFITPWVLMALKLVGGEYSDKDVQLYVEGSFTELMAGWIEKNWPRQC
jgi:hypothetical protein